MRRDSSESHFDYRPAGLLMFASLAIGSMLQAQDATEPGESQASPPSNYGGLLPTLPPGTAKHPTTAMQYVPTTLENGMVVMKPVYSSLPGVKTVMTPAYSNYGGELTSFADEMKTLRSESATAEQKEGAKRTMREKLGDMFEADLKLREKQIEELEKRIAKLKADVEKRRDAKRRIIDLKIEVMQNEAEGLGFPNPGPTVWQPGFWRQSSASERVYEPGHAQLPPMSTSVPPSSGLPTKLPPTVNVRRSR